MENKNLFFTVLVAVLILFVFGLFQGNIAGEVASDNNAYRGIYSCLDSDVNSEELAGYVEVRIGKDTQRYYDRCINGGLKVIENFCTINKNGDYSRAFTEVWCDFGEICDDGRCIEDTAKDTRGIYGIERV